MLRVSAGHYRDSFCNTVYEVKRYSFPAGTKMQRGWSFGIDKFGMTKLGFTGKEEAAQRARVAIYDWHDAEAARQRAFDEGNRRHPLPISGARP